MSDQFVVTSSPHLQSKGNTAGIMWLVLTDRGVEDGEGEEEPR